MSTIKTYFCLGNGEIACDGCGLEDNWQQLNSLPNEYRLRLQAEAEMQRVDDTDCILRGRPWFVPKGGKIPTGISAYRDDENSLVSTYPDGQARSFCESEKPVPNGEEPRLDKPAMVGNGRFGKGVPWRTVIGAAQRLHEAECTPEKEALRISNVQSTNIIVALRDAEIEALKRQLGQMTEEAQVPSESTQSQMTEVLAAINQHMHEGPCPSGGCIGECACIDIGANGVWWAALYIWDNDFNDSTLVAKWFRDTGATDVLVSHVLFDSGNGDRDGRCFDGVRAWHVEFGYEGGCQQASSVSPHPS